VLNENDLAQAITMKEGGHKQTDIAQVKEVMRCLLELLALKKASEVMELVERHRL
jgi:hypothetical protein